MTLLWLLGFLISAIVAGCAANPGKQPTIDELLPAGATKALIPDGYGMNHLTPKGEYAWAQGFKYSGDLSQLLAELDVKLNPLGFSLEDHSNYRGTFGTSGVSNTAVLRIYRGPGMSVGVFDFNPLPSKGEKFANYAITLRLR